MGTGGGGWLAILVITTHIEHVVHACVRHVDELRPIDVAHLIRGMTHQHSHPALRVGKPLPEPGYLTQPVFSAESYGLEFQGRR